MTTNILSVEEIASLKSPELKALASELQIAGRSKLKILDLRIAVQNKMAELRNSILLDYKSGGNASPLSMEQRGENYFKQNGGNFFTPKQAKRLNKKANRLVG